MLSDEKHHQYLNNYIFSLYPINLGNVTHFLVIKSKLWLSFYTSRILLGDAEEIALNPGIKDAS